MIWQICYFSSCYDSWQWHYPDELSRFSVEIPIKYRYYIIAIADIISTCTSARRQEILRTHKLYFFAESVLIYFKEQIDKFLVINRSRQ